MSLRNNLNFTKKLFRRISSRNFRDNTGLALKNSIFHFLTGIIAKVGALFYTILLLRILMPEKFGLYSLALSTILLFVSFSDLGIGQAIIRFVSREFGKGDKKKAAAYAVYLTKIKMTLFVIVSILLIISSKFIANTYYQKPISLALLAGSAYIILAGMVTIIQTLFQSINNFKPLFYKETIFQILRLFLIPTAVLFLLKNVSASKSIFLIILLLDILVLITLIFLMLFSNKLGFLKYSSVKLNVIEKKEARRFTWELGILGLAGLLFGYTDMIFLGRYVNAEFIGFYQAAFSFIVSSIPLISFSSALFPIFSRLSGERLKRGFAKSRNITLLLSLVVFLITLLFAPIIIQIIGGANYENSVLILRALSFLSISMPLSSLYSSYILAKGYPKSQTYILATSTLINLILNFLLITSLLKYGQMAAVIGSCIATVVSNYFYLVGLIITNKKLKD